MKKRTKYDTNFNPTLCEVVKRTGPEAVIQSPSGNSYRKPLKHLKKVLIPADDDDNESNEEEEGMVREPQGIGVEMNERGSGSEQSSEDEFVAGRRRITASQEQNQAASESEDAGRDQSRQPSATEAVNEAEYCTFNPPALSTPLVAESRPIRVRRPPLRLADYTRGQGLSMEEGEGM